ncbi:hypothetical protein JCM16408A_53600 [Methylobacterium phyllosphaerae]
MLDLKMLRMPQVRRSRKISLRNCAAARGQMILRWVAPASKLRACRGLYRHLFPVPLTQSVGRFRRMTFDRPIRCIKGIRPSGSRRRHGMPTCALPLPEFTFGLLRNAARRRRGRPNFPYRLL